MTWKLAPKLDRTIAFPPAPLPPSGDQLLLRRASEWLLAYWRRARAGEVLPPASALDDLFATEFGAYCVGGQISMTDGARVTRMGRRFSQAFERKAIDSADAFSAAAMLGILIGLAGELLNDPRPIQRSGDFTSEGNWLVRYHAAAMPFRGGLAAAPAWLAVAEWHAAPLSTVTRLRAS